MSGPTQSGPSGPKRGAGWDDDDWVGEPPEGRHTREQSNPGFWATQKPLVVTLFWLGLLVLAVVVVILAT
ncbi:MAG TPA: hypothetical protein VF549_02405 [Solirubrobacteraceae bacterium]